MSHVLIVEDERTTAALMQRFLEDAGSPVEVAPSAEACLDALSRSLPDALCLALHLPGIGGLEALDAIRARPLRLPIVIMTADREVETVVAAMQRGAYDYLP